MPPQLGAALDSFLGNYRGGYKLAKVAMALARWHKIDPIGFSKILEELDAATKWLDLQIEHEKD